MKALTVFNGFWMFIAEITGVMEAHCKVKHRSFHKLHQIEYNGTCVVECSRCNRQFFRT